MSRPAKPWKEYGRYGSVGIELVLSIMLGYYAGHWLDGKIGGGHGWITAAGFLIGVYAGFRALFAAASYMERDIAQAERRERREWEDSRTDAHPSPPPPADPNQTADDEKKHP